MEKGQGVWSRIEQQMMLFKTQSYYLAEMFHRCGVTNGRDSIDVP
jgi:hypothetical protein